MKCSGYNGAFGVGFVNTMVVRCRFQVEAYTNFGDSILLVGSTRELGHWTLKNGLKLRTCEGMYPLWWSDAVTLSEEKIVYKYARVNKGDLTWPQWEVDGSRLNRHLTVKEGNYVIHDFLFGRMQAYSFGYSCSEESLRANEPAPFPNLTYNPPLEQVVVSDKMRQLTICILGSSVACGCFAFNLKGWSSKLKDVLKERYGHTVVNVAMAGANVEITNGRFASVVTPREPQVVIISLSLGNEGTFHCEPYERRTKKEEFVEGIRSLIDETRRIGAVPVLGGVYPNGDCTPDAYELLKETRENLRLLACPVFDWLNVLDNGDGRWKEGLSTDIAHPNSEGHRLMFDCIDLELFDPNSDKYICKDRSTSRL